MTTYCLLCGAPAVHEHHPTGRLAPDRPRLDPIFVIAICRACHYAEHSAWRDVGLDVMADPLTARLRRVAWLVGRLADLDRPVIFPANTLRGWHGSLIACVGLADNRSAEVRP